MASWGLGASTHVRAAHSQGRGQATHAFTHALETGHHMFMKLSDGRAYCLPEGYEVDDRSLDPIRYVLNPTFAPDKARTHCTCSPCCVVAVSAGRSLSRVQQFQAQAAVPLQGQ